MTDDELRKIADELGESIEIVRGVADAMAVCADEGPSEARNERHERARDAYYDGSGASQVGDVDAAIESAMTVAVTDEIVAAARDRLDECGSSESVESALRAAFAAAGFVVTP